MSEKIREFGRDGYYNERWGKKRKIKIEMEGNWDDIDRLIALLKQWQSCGGVGHYASTSITMDGDCCSHPEFLINNKNIYEFKNKFMEIKKDEYEKKDGWDKISDTDIKIVRG